MIAFNATIQKFAKQGEKTGWTNFEIPLDIAERILPGIKKSYRVKGSLDNYLIQGISIIPMGEGNFIMPLNANMRKHLKKGMGDELKVKLIHDPSEYELNKDLIECLSDDKDALTYFQSISKSHQKYFSKYIDTAKSETTKAKRIAKIIKAMIQKQTYSEMLRSDK
ncbi:MAG: DUF1905 domain-containing protein [Bacteroidetes bacterium]|nr:DUF1905 domain-containing protein [Bacteroidota bacterium]